MSSNLNYSYINQNGKPVYGSAAFNHLVYTILGGIQNYNDLVGTQYVLNWINNQSDNINSEISRTVKKQMFKAV